VSRDDAPAEPNIVVLNHIHETVSDPVQDAVDIIVKHYEEQEFAKARTVAAAKAAAALREFANRIEASA
jgi:hypothetical protein